MIVLDENIHDSVIKEAIGRWYSGQVLSVTKLRPQSKIKDEAIPTLLRGADQPTFVTLNVSDFWRHVAPSFSFCIIALELTQEQRFEISDILRSVLAHNLFKTKNSRMGKIIHWMPTYLEYYESNQQIHRIETE